METLTFCPLDLTTSTITLPFTWNHSDSKWWKNKLRNCWTVAKQHLLKPWKRSMIVLRHCFFCTCTKSKAKEFPKSPSKVSSQCSRTETVQLGVVLQTSNFSWEHSQRFWSWSQNKWGKSTQSLENVSMLISSTPSA